jgi:tetratricopeptide (TPR) repeat protein
MALHGLGKIYARLAERADDDVHLNRKAMTMYSAALGARPDNHLAANELGVLLARNGRPAEAARMFERTIDLAASATAYHNLAVAQRKLGMWGQAATNEQESQRLAAWERATGAVSRRAGVAWVSPAEMTGGVRPTSVPRAVAAASVPEKSAWQKTVELAKSLPVPRVGSPKSQAAAISEPHVPVPFSAPPLPDKTYQR